MSSHGALTEDVLELGASSASVVTEPSALSSSVSAAHSKLLKTVWDFERLRSVVVRNHFRKFGIADGVG